jgi:RecB family endonuclease NucS
MTTTRLHRPTHRDAFELVGSAFENGRLLTMFGRCEVHYDGRAASTLGPGQRLVIYKPDGTALVHTAENREPVNWQPPGSTHNASVRDGQLQIRSTRSNPTEQLDVLFERVETVSAYAVTDRSDLKLTGSEEDLRQWILNQPEVIEKGFHPIATERQTKAGPIDIFGEDTAGRPVVIELKRRRVGPSAASQLQRYVEAITTELSNPATRGILVAPSITDRAASLLDKWEFEYRSLEIE